MAVPDFPEAQRIIYLVSRYIDGSIDFAELQELDEWRNEEPGNEILFKELSDPGRQASAVSRMQQYDSKGSLRTVKKLIANHQKRSKASLTAWTKLLVAASIVTLIGVLLFLYHLQPPKDNIALSKPSPQYIAPGSNKAILTLADGKRISLNDEVNGTIAHQSGSVIQKDNEGFIAYHATLNNDTIITEYNLIETPRGGQYKLQLSDGTKVWLNAASTLRYPAKFSGKKREVSLTGEAYFEVAHNSESTFIVKTTKQEIKDIGTRFNVNTYDDEPQASTTLVEGAVDVSTALQKARLKPGQQAVSRLGRLQVSETDVKVAIAWKEGKLAFHRTNIQNVLRQVSRWYNVEIEYKGKIPNFTISGEVSRQADLSAMLKILQLSDVHIEQQGRKLIITN